jgi:translation initiation factor 6
MRVFKTTFASNPNVGLYMYCSNKYCLVGSQVPSKQVKKIEEVFGVPVIRMSVAGTPLLGPFLAGNDNCLLVPPVIFDFELNILKQNKIPYKVINTKLTALGNNLVCNNNGAIINDEFEKEAVEEIKKALKVEVKFGRIAGLEIPGSLCVANDQIAVVHDKISNKEIALVEKVLKVSVLPVTIDYNPYIRGGFVLNNSGYLITDTVNTLELTAIDQALNEQG